MDIFISTALAVLTIVMAYLGVHVSLHPTDSIRKQRAYKAGFCTCAIFAVALVIWQGARTGGAQQRSETAQRRNEAEQEELRGQIKQLVSGSTQTQTSLDDLKNLHEELREQRAQLEAISDALKLPKPRSTPPSVKLPQVVQQQGSVQLPPLTTHTPTSAPLPVTHVRYTARATSSTRDDAPFALQVIIQTDTPIDNPNFTIECDGPLVDGRFFIAGSALMMGVRTSRTENSFSFGIQYPQFKPEAPIVVTLLSKTEIHVLRVGSGH